MPSRLQTYQTGEVTVTFDPGVCIHSAVCLQSLPGVFDVRRKQWIDLAQAPAAAVVDTVRRCPSGALQVTVRAEGTASTSPAQAPTAAVKVLPDGPIELAGPVRITLEDGSVDERAGRVFLCRCGGSAKKPFCDGSHKRIGFRRVSAPGE